MNERNAVYHENSGRAHVAYEKLVSGFCKDDNSVIYPDSYGGAYVNRSGKLVVLVVESANDVDAWITNTNDSVIETCKYSYNQLLSTMTSINDYMSNPKDSMVAGNIIAVGLYDDKNQIIVEMKEISMLRINEFKNKVIDSPCVKFTLSTTTCIDNYDIICGSAISAGNKGGSVAYRALKNGVVGFVTAAHVVQSVDIGSNQIAVDGVPCAMCTDRVIGGTLDAAFCAITNPSYIPTNVIRQSAYSLSTMLWEAAVGEIVNLRGKYSATSGVVLSTNYSTTINNIYFTGLVKATYTSVNGDSGGLIYTYLNGTSTCYTTGIHKGCALDGSFAFYVKAGDANNTMSISRY